MQSRPNGSMYLRVVQDIRVRVPALRCPQPSTCVVGIRGHEAAHGGGVVASAEVVEAGFGVAFLAGEVHGAGVGAATTIGLPIAKGQAGCGFAESAAHVGPSALSAQPIGMDEVG